MAGSVGTGTAGGAGCDSDAVFEEYMRVCYCWAGPAESHGRGRTPQDEELAEADARLRAALRADPGLRHELRAKARGGAPLLEQVVCFAGAPGFHVRTWVRGWERGLPELVAEVSPLGVEVPGEQPMHFEVVRGLGQQAGVLWPAALGLGARLLADAALTAPLLRPGARVIELGAGVGFLGALLARLGGRVLLTDLPETGDFALRGARRNAGGAGAAALRSAALDWRCTLPPEVAEGCPWDAVLCSDLLHNTDLHGPLCSTLKHLAAGPASQVLFAYESRCLSREEAFFGLVQGYFSIEALRPDHAADDFRLLRFRPLPVGSGVVQARAGLLPA